MIRCHQIFYLSSYRDVIQFLCSVAKISISELAEAVRVSKQYLSRVLNGSGNISEDQAFFISQSFDLSEIETEYFLLLVREERAQRPALKAHIQKQRLAIQAKINN